MITSEREYMAVRNRQVAAALTWEAAVTAGPEVCGGKGYNLGRLHRYGFRIPRGGVIPAAWYLEIFASLPADTMALVRDVTAENVTDPSVLSALDAIRTSLETAEIPTDLAAGVEQFLRDQGISEARVSVRSSATMEDGARASFAGIHRSFLNVAGIEGILRSVLGCYASLWTPQAVAYRRKMNFTDDEVLCAVVICEMVDAQCAGVAFSFDPASGRRDVIVIDGAPGLGEAVVGGVVDPQRIVYRNAKGRFNLDSRTGGDALLPARRERELACQVHRMEWAFGDGQDPQDVEWAYDGARIWFLQVRPATNVRRFLPAPVSHLPRHWSTANIKDAVPGVICTLSWSLLKNTVGAIAFAGPVIGGYRMETGAEVVRRFRGRAYFDLTLMQWVLYDALGVTPAQVVQSIGGHQPEIPVPGDPSKGPEGRRRLKASLRLLRKIWTVERDLARVMSKREDWIREVRKLEGAELTTPELMAMYEKLEARMDAMDMTIGVANSAEGPWEMALESILKPLFGDQARPMMGKLLAGTGSVTSAEHGYAIFRLAAAARHDDVARRWLESAAPGTGWVSLPQGSAFRAALAAFLEEFGHRAVYEADYLNPRWAEDPTYILDQVRFLLANPQAPGHRDAAERLREEAEAAVRQKAGWRAPIVFWIVRKLQRAMAVRERAKSELAALAMGSKRLSLSIGRRMANAGHLNEAQEIFFLSAVDIQCWLEGFWSGAGAHELASDRARQREAWLAQEAPPDVITEEANGRVTAIPVASGRQGETWSGIGAAPGRARGPARIIRHPGEGHTLQAGEVLVAPSTDPGWTPLFLRASAIVMASGGYLSHGAIVAREYGIPAVVNLPGILEDLRPGDRIVVDGDAGRVVRE